MEEIIAEGTYESDKWVLRIIKRNDDISIIIEATSPDGKTLWSGGSDGLALQSRSIMNVGSGGGSSGPYFVYATVPSTTVDKVTLNMFDGKKLDVPLYTSDLIPEIRIAITPISPDRRISDIMAIGSGGQLLEVFDLSFHQQHWHRKRDQRPL